MGGGREQGEGLGTSRSQGVWRTWWFGIRAMDLPSSAVSGEKGHLACDPFWERTVGSQGQSRGPRSNQVGDGGVDPRGGGGGGSGG